MKITNLKRVMGFESKVLEKRIKKGAKLDTTTLQKSVDVSFDASKSLITMTLTTEDYAYWVDKGRKPGKGMPVQPLKDWIIRKGLTVQDVNGNTVNMTDSRLNGLSYIINRKIREKGIKGNKFIETPVDLMFDTIEDRLVDAFILDIDNLIHGRQ